MSLSSTATAWSYREMADVDPRHKTAPALEKGRDRAQEEEGSTACAARGSIRSEGKRHFIQIKDSGSRQRTSATQSKQNDADLWSDIVALVVTRGLVTPIMGSAHTFHGTISLRTTTLLVHVHPSSARPAPRKGHFIPTTVSSTSN